MGKKNLLNSAEVSPFIKLKKNKLQGASGGSQERTDARQRACARARQRARAHALQQDSVSLSQRPHGSANTRLQASGCIPQPSTVQPGSKVMILVPAF